MLFILFIFFPITISAQCTLTPDSENVVASQLAGDWQIDVNLTAQLMSDYEGWITAISFTDNPSIVDMLPEEECEEWMEEGLFLAGEAILTMEQETLTGV